MKNATAPKAIIGNREDHGRIISQNSEGEFLDTVQLNRLEKSFRDWLKSSRNPDTHFSRQRILIIFLLIRYTGAKLNEVLSLDPFTDMDWIRHGVVFRGRLSAEGLEPGEVQISESLACEIREALKHPGFQKVRGNALNLDPGFVRRKFYERAQACGFSKYPGGPGMIRKARAVELMQGNLPLPAVQVMLGHTSPNITSSYMSFSKEEIRNISKRFIEKESARKTSARNSFFGKIGNLRKGDIQTLVELITLDGFTITSVITNNSVERLGLGIGRLMTAEVKAPWVCLERSDMEPECSSENRIKGVIERITEGRINTEGIIRVSDMTELCSVISTKGYQHLNLKKGDEIWCLFNCFSVVLHAD
jgi:molybdate transport system regulatory protein